MRTRALAASPTHFVGFIGRMQQESSVFKPGFFFDIDSTYRALFDEPFFSSFADQTLAQSSPDTMLLSAMLRSDITRAYRVTAQPGIPWTGAT